VEKKSQSTGTPQRTGKVWVLSGEYEPSVLKTKIAYLLIRTDDLVRRHADPSKEQGGDAMLA
jgi:hypothetical protein